MFSRLRRHLSYANVAATLAVVFAMSGGAYALGGGGHQPAGSASASTAHAAKKVKKRSKSTAGARGPAGAQGLAGAQGPAGAAGPQGEKGPGGEKGAAGAAGKEGAAGPQGPAGPQGVPGPKGQSVTSEAFEGKKGTCESGGSEFKVGTGTTYACNGKDGSGGGGGGTLQPGQTERGVWVAATTLPVGSEYYGLITISLASAFNGELPQPHYVKSGEDTEECGEYGGNNRTPIPSPGEFCLYEGANFGEVKFEGGFSEGINTGENLYFSSSKPGFARGVWAVTAAE
jgi:hypothetical protein